MNKITNKFNIIIFIMVLSFFYSCSNSLNSLPSHQKAFNEEDRFIMQALEYTMSKEYSKAIKTYSYLYEKSHKIEYLIEEVSIYLSQKKYKKASSKLLEIYKKNEKDEQILALLSETYILSKDTKKASFYALKLLELKRNERNYLIVANSYITGSKFNIALKYLEGAYKYFHNPIILEKMVSIMYSINNDKKKAISYLESHMRLYSFDRTIADKLVLFYKQTSNVNGLISIYKTLYSKFPDDGYEYDIINLLIAKNAKYPLVNFIKLTNINSVVLSRLHGFINNSKLSKNISLYMYQKTKDINFLAQFLMYRYDYLLKNKKLKRKQAKRIYRKFSKIIKKLDNSKYFNFYGYISIKHNFDIKKGIVYIKKALNKTKSPYYMDSLAWGYFKLKKYDEAYAIMKDVVKAIGLLDEEIREHWKKIEKAAGK